MDFSNRKFRNNRTGEIIKVIDTFENIAILENRQKVDVRQLQDPLQFTEEIDPTSFFDTQGAYNTLAEKIKNIPINMIGEDPVELTERFGGELSPATNESAVIMTTEEDEMQELAKKYGIEQDPGELVAKQQNAFAKILGEDIEDLPVVKPFTPPVEQVTKIEVDREEVKRPEIANIPPQVSEDPIISMFRKAKRTQDFQVDLKIENKIPRLDFIEMMEDSYELSIIDYLAEEFTNDLLKNPNFIKEVVKEKIKEMVSKKGKPEKHPPLEISKEPVLSKDLPKKTTTRKPRPNTAQGEKPGYKAPIKKQTKGDD
jgi:hypothetical protein